MPTPIEILQQVADEIVPPDAPARPQHRSRDVEAERRKAKAEAKRILATGGQNLRAFMNAAEWREYCWHYDEMGWSQEQALVNVLYRRQLAI